MSCVSVFVSLHVNTVSHVRNDWHFSYFVYRDVSFPYLYGNPDFFKFQSSFRVFVNRKYGKSSSIQSHQKCKKYQRNNALQMPGPFQYTNFNFALIDQPKYHYLLHTGLPVQRSDSRVHAWNALLTSNRHSSLCMGPIGETSHISTSIGLLLCTFVTARISRLTFVIFVKIFNIHINISRES